MTVREEGEDLEEPRVDYGDTDVKCVQGGWISPKTGKQNKCMREGGRERRTDAMTDCVVVVDGKMRMGGMDCETPVIEGGKTAQNDITRCTEHLDGSLGGIREKELRRQSERGEGARERDDSCGAGDIRPKTQA